MSKVFKAENQYEKLLTSLPTDCQCSACKDTRKHIEDKIGKKRYTYLTKIIEKNS